MEKLLKLSHNQFKDLTSKIIYLDNFVYFDGELFIEIIKFKPEYKENKYKKWNIEISRYDIYKKHMKLVKFYELCTSDKVDYIDASLISNYSSYDKRKIKKIFKFFQDMIREKTQEEVLKISRQNQNSTITLGMNLLKIKSKNIIDVNKSSNYPLFLLDEKGYNKLGYNLFGNEIKIENTVERTKLIIKEKIENKEQKPNIYDIYEAIKDERDSSEKKILFTLKNSNITMNILKISLDLNVKNSGKLDEDLEGCKVWWINKEINGKQTKGVGEVLSIDIESEIINIRFFKGEKPLEGTKIIIYPKEYLEALENLWMDREFSRLALNNYYSSTLVYNNKIKIPKEFNWLRENQKKAYDLFSYNRGILWGPPGTGKTTTLGALISSYMIANPANKILILSLTNLAIDQFLSSVDKQLEKFEFGDELQKKCVRLGSNINSEYYKNKNYLVATKDNFLLEELVLLESKKPDKKEAVAYSNWLKEYEELKLKMKINIEEIVNKKTLIALTTTRALFEFESLSNGKFDLIVFDEASQISLPQAMMLSQLGKQVIYAGDQEQLNPICVSKNLNTKRFMGVSIFEHANSLFKDSNFFLNEQSRMSKDICNLVSKLFYNDKLIVSLKEENCLSWLKERELKRNSLVGDNSIFIEKIPKNGTFSQKYRGFIRYESAEFIFELCKSLVKEYEQNKIVVLVPFKAQKNLILSFLRKENIHNISVKTVHKSQGSEYHTVIFDPVVGNEEFLKTKEAKNLINVALSRAKARLIMCFSEEDLKNTIFNKISNITNYSNHTDFYDLKEYINKQNFPFNLIGKCFNNNFFKGKVLEISKDAKKIKVLSFDTGEEKKYLLKSIIYKLNTR